jgi:transcriptional regulator NrdR family protein
MLAEDKQLVRIKKRSGKIEEFIESKIATSCEKAGASAKQAQHVADQVSKMVAPKREVTADDLSNMVATSLRKVNKAAAGNFTKFRDIKLMLALWSMPEKDMFYYKPYKPTGRASSRSR